MKRILLALLFFPLILAAETLTNEDVLRLLNQGDLSEKTILLLVQNSDGDYDTTASDIIALTKAGVPDSILQAMIQKSSGESTTARRPSRSTTGVDPASIVPPTIQPEPGNVYFLRHTLSFERDTWPVTNYWRGDRMPINTRVELLKIGRKSFSIRAIESGQELEIENIEKYSQKTPDELAAQMLADQRIPIEKLGEERARDIENGMLRLGMTKEEAIMTRGYPPSHKTPSTDVDTWIYWNSRFAQQTIVFSDNLLVEGRGIR